MIKRNGFLFSSGTTILRKGMNIEITVLEPFAIYAKRQNRRFALSLAIRGSNFAVHLICRNLTTKAAVAMNAKSCIFQLNASSDFSCFSMSHISITACAINMNKQKKKKKRDV